MIDEKEKKLKRGLVFGGVVTVIFVLFTVSCVLKDGKTKLVYPEDTELEATTVPETYCIDYGPNHLGNVEYVREIAAAPPTILHVGVDTVINNIAGTTMYGEGMEFDVENQLTPSQLEARIRDIRAFVQDMHAAGVKTVMAYQSGSFFFGDHERRTGLFKFYDHWDDYAEFGIGPRPEVDPTEWPARDRRTIQDKPGLFVYYPCINHPGWHALVRMTASWAARAGYDALFSDVNSHHCYKPSCRDAFRKYLSAKYTPADLKRLFGFKSPEEIQMGKPGGGLLWVETQHHWGNSFAEMFAEMTEVGRQYVRGFFVLPNSSSYSDIPSTYRRRTSGQNIGIWARSVPIFMYEKMEQPGRFGRTAITDNFLQYKYAFANCIRPAVLLYNSQEPHSIALSNAEAAALGGGSFIQGQFKCPEVRTAYRKFFESNHDLLAGFSSYAQVALVFFYDELLWENPKHLEQVFCLKDYLCSNHVLWDFIVEKNFTGHQLAKYKVVIVPELRHLSNDQAELLRQYADGGGGVVLISEAGRFTDEAVRRRMLPLEDILSGKAKDGVRSGCCGEGWVVHAKNIEDLIERPAFEIFQLTGEQSSDRPTILKLMAQAEADNKPKGTDRLLGLCEQMAKCPLSVADEAVPFTLRMAAYWRRDADGRRLTVHLLNYDSVIHEHHSDLPVPAKNVSLCIPLPSGWQPRQVRLRGPQAPANAVVPFKLEQGRLLVTVPQVEIYEIVDVAAE